MRILEYFQASLVSKQALSVPLTQRQNQPNKHNKPENTNI